MDRFQNKITSRFNFGPFNIIVSIYYTVSLNYPTNSTIELPTYNVCIHDDGGVYACEWGNLYSPCARNYTREPMPYPVLDTGY